jgi:hypothetical protein
MKEMVMKIQFAGISLIALFAATASGGVLAHEEYSETGLYHRIEHVRTDPTAPSTRAEAFNPEQYVEGASLYLIARDAQTGSVRGLAGPVRSDPFAEAAERNLERALGPIGGRNTF